MLDFLLVQLLVALEINCPHIVAFSYRHIVLVSSEVLQTLGVFPCLVVLSRVKVLEVLGVSLCPLDVLTDLHGLVLELVTRCGILHEDLVLVAVDVGLVHGSLLVVIHSLLILLLLHVHLVSILSGRVFLSSLFDLVSEFRVFVGNPDLSLESSLFVLQLPQSVFHHLGLITVTGAPLNRCFDKYEDFGNSPQVAFI